MRGRMNEGYMTPPTSVVRNAIYWHTSSFDSYHNGVKFDEKGNLSLNYEPTIRLCVGTCLGTCLGTCSQHLADAFPTPC